MAHPSNSDSHPTEAELQALADEEGPAARQRALRLHGERCEACGDRLRSLARESREIAESLRLLDHPPPKVPVGTIVARAQSRRPLRRGLMAAGLSGLFAAASAAAVIPGSSLNQYLGRVWTTWRQAPPSVLEPTPVQPQLPRVGGVAFVPGSEVEIVFNRAQLRGAIRVSLVGTSTVRITGSGAGAYAVEPARVTIDNQAADGTYEIVIPRTVPHARIRVAGRVVFEKTGVTVSTQSSSDGGGGYLIPFSGGAAEGSGRDALPELR